MYIKFIGNFFSFKLDKLVVFTIELIPGPEFSDFTTNLWP